MRFRRLKLVGFKSFVEPAELRIEPGLTGIVGPNGCGKSNLLEALRWVMGEASPKSMRGGGMEDVIFAGTATRPSRGFAEVQLHADRSDAEGNELEVVRRIERGAGSGYRINGRDVRARDVALIFADAATGAHSPALVSQGRIGAVIAAKPAERRAMLEEAAGIAGLHVRRRDAEQKLRATEANLARLDELLSDMAARASALKRQARQAERYRVLSGDIRVAEARLIFARWRDAAAAAERARAEASDAEDAVHRAAEDQRAAAAHATEANRGMADARATAQAARDRVSEAGHRLAALTAERSALTARIAEIARQTERLAADRAREGALAIDASEAIARLGTEAALLDARIADATAQQPALAQLLATAEDAGRDADLALARALATQAGEQADARVAQAAAAAARLLVERADAELGRLRRDAEALSDAAALNATRDAAITMRGGAEAARDAAITQADAAEGARTAAAAARDLADEAAAAARASAAALDAEARTLRAAAPASGAGDSVLSHIRVDPGYEHALAAALGDDLHRGTGGDARWSGAEPLPGDPALPAGVLPLADLVSGAPALARRLAQIGVVDADDGAPLAVGQRIVTRAGALRRWDGLIVATQGADAADHMVRANRLDQLEALLPDAREAAEAAARAAAVARTDLAAATAAIEAARIARADAEARARLAAREEDQASSAIERLAVRHAEVTGGIARASQERAQAEASRVAAAEAASALPDGLATSALVQSLTAASRDRREAIAQAKTDAAANERMIAADRDRAAAVAAETSGWKGRAGTAAKRIDDMTRHARAAEAEATALIDAPAALEAKLVALKAEQESAAAAAATHALAETAAGERLRGAETMLAGAGEALAAAREFRAGSVARAESQDLRRVEIGRIAGERFECPPPLLPERVGFEGANLGDPAAESSRHERLMLERERIGPVNLIAEQELGELEAGHASGIAERDELAAAIARLRGSIGSLNREGRTRLLAAFETVNAEFRRLFGTLFGGGEAYLSLVDADDPLEAGLEIMAQPPGKKLATLTLLSGGEQALIAIALIFALFLTNPAPICVLDEVDAPLDDANIERFCDLLDAMVAETDTRYLIVTHNAVTMSRMHRLFGVTMIEQGVSRLVSVDLGGAGRLLAAE